MGAFGVKTAKVAGTLGRHASGGLETSDEKCTDSRTPGKGERHAQQSTCKQVAFKETVSLVSPPES